MPKSITMWTCLASPAVAVAGRMQLLRHCAGGRLVDDSYNASPLAVRRLLELLARAPGRRVAVIGEMYELGELAAAPVAEEQFELFGAGHLVYLLMMATAVAFLIWGWRDPGDASRHRVRLVIASIMLALMMPT